MRVKNNKDENATIFRFVRVKGKISLMLMRAYYFYNGLHIVERREFCMDRSFLLMHEKIIAHYESRYFNDS